MGIGMSAAELFDLSATIKADTSHLEKGLTSAQKQVIQLAKDFEKTEAVAVKAATHMGQSMAQAQAQISKMRVSNLSADYDKFTNALHNNSTKVKKSADDFLALLGNVGGGSKAVRAAEQETVKLGHAFRALSSAAVIADGPMGGIASRLRAMGTEAAEISSAFGPAGWVVAGIAALAGGSLLAGVGLFELAKSAAEYGDSIDDAHEKTSLSVATLSALKVAGREAGVSLESMTGGLVRFTRNLEEASSGNKKMAAEMKQLGITAFHDSDLALKQFLASFARLKTDEERTLAATEMFGARFGANLIETFGKVGGDMPKFEEHLRSIGLLMSEEDAKAADEFEKSLADLNMRLEGVTRTLGQEMIPAFEAGILAIEAALDANKTNWKEWGEDLAKIILTVESLIGGLVGAVRGLVNAGPTGAVIGAYTGMISTADQVTRSYNLMVNPPVGAGVDMPGFGAKRFSMPKAGGGGGSKGADPAATAKRLADINLNILLDSFKAEEEAFKRSLVKRTIDFDQYVAEVNVLETERHRAVLAGLVTEGEAAERLKNASQKQIALREIDRKTLQEGIRHKQALTKVEDEQAKFTDQVNEFIKDQSKAISESVTETSKWMSAIDNLVESLRKEGVTLDPTVEKMLRFRAAAAGAADSVKRLNEMLAAQGPAADSGPFVSTTGITDEEMNKRLLDAINRGMGGAAPPGVRIDKHGVMTTVYDDILKFKDRMHEVARDLTSTISGALQAGFEHGIKAGLKSFAEGILQMIEGAAMRALEEKLFQIFSKGLGGKSGVGASTGGGIGGIISSILGSFAGGFAGGGFIPSGQWGIVGERGPEIVRGGGSGAMVSQGGGSLTINYYAARGDNPASQATVYQMARQLQAHMGKVMATA